jgi:hypothetical protein
MNICREDEESSAAVYRRHSEGAKGLFSIRQRRPEATLQLHVPRAARFSPIEANGGIPLLRLRCGALLRRPPGVPDDAAAGTASLCRWRTLTDSGLLLVGWWGIRSQARFWTLGSRLATLCNSCESMRNVLQIEPQLAARDLSDRAHSLSASFIDR